MIRTAILACALMAVPSAALAQYQAILPEVRMIRAPASPGDGPPADYVADLAPEYNGWIYQEVSGGGRPIDPSVAPVTTTIYQGRGYPATIMVCPRIGPIRLLTEGQGEVTVQNNRCATVTTEQLRLASVSHQSNPRQIRYRIIAVHRAAD
jgi:hypothetical protein